MDEEYVCGKCDRVLGFSFIRFIGCLCLGGHEYRVVKKEMWPGYFGVKNAMCKDACTRCGSTQWRRGYD